jgi:dolichol-phosphate mannosyltransferase
MQQKDHLVIIPLYNEEESVIPVFEELRSHYHGDVLIIDDGSTDASIERLSHIACDHCKVLSHRSNMGYGASLMDGFAFAIGARYRLTLTMDCDRQHEPAFVPQLLAAIADKDILSGSRYLSSSAASGVTPPDRAAINHEITERLNTITGYQLTDAFCGFKVYRTEALARLTLTNSGYAFRLQLWIQAWKNELTVGEMSVPKIYTGETRSFGEDLDEPAVRLQYYHHVIDQELQ